MLTYKKNAEKENNIIHNSLKKERKKKHDSSGYT